MKWKIRLPAVYVGLAKEVQNHKRRITIENVKDGCLLEMQWGRNSVREGCRTVYDRELLNEIDM